MQPNYAMNDAGWDKLIADVAYLFDDLTLKRGFQYYKQKKVRALRMVSAQTVMALVEGKEDYSVVMETDSLSGSECSCTEPKPCKHMAAVLMGYAESQERPLHLIANAKSAASRLKAEEASGAAVQGSSRKERLQQLSLLIREGTDLEKWREYMTLATAPLAQSVRNPSYTGKALENILANAPRLSSAAMLLFELHAHLFVLESLLKPNTLHIPGAVSNTGYSSLGYYTSIAVAELQESITGLVNRALPLPEEPESWPVVKDTLTYLRREMLTEPRERSREQPYYSLCYDLVWCNWIVPNAEDQTIYTEELQALRLMEDELGAAGSRHALLLAESRMHYYLQDDRAALELLGQAGERPGVYPGELMGFLAPLKQAGQWSRLAAWLRETGPLLTSRLYNLREYAGYWDETVRHMPEAEPMMWDTLAGMLPLSREIYDDRLLAYEKWQEWMDFQLSSGKAPSDFRVSDLQPVEKNAPQLLLPFYHQAVERFVLEKNRHSYKAAVKLLKRLAKLYKKLKREERWEEFLESFTAKYSRLRALLEELRKGKLIP
ncbi:hypothetical protein C2I18_13295 [Paenibacillus sp. PK3_47]|uniref:SWIM zinc finger family protein n=1 Tax=Paenibacillus sp. PK3_47 TaxID=2072642 RepID=UPI00201D5CD0|nr:SWIM zinc finger family protein [Paenibacillus sp. PK3_47]UQZ34407.1 hypothetical protein C2I18_13295 [Paenibacillus sp. PK3_47]